MVDKGQAQVGMVVYRGPSDSLSSVFSGAPGVLLYHITRTPRKEVPGSTALE